MTEKAANHDHVVAQLAALETVLTIERQRSDEWKAVADRFAEQAERLTERLAERESRSFWRRLVG